MFSTSDLGSHEIAARPCARLLRGLFGAAASATEAEASPALTADDVTAHPGIPDAAAELGGAAATCARAAEHLLAHALGLVQLGHRLRERDAQEQGGNEEEDRLDHGEG